MSKALIVSMAISACVVSTAYILAEGEKQPSVSSFGTETSSEKILTPDGGRLVSDKVERFKIYNFSNREGRGFLITLIREETNKLVAFRSDKTCATIDKIQQGQIVNLRYVVTRYNTFPAQSEKVYGGEILCPA